MDNIYKVFPKCGEDNFKNNFKCMCGHVFDGTYKELSSQKPGSNVLFQNHQLSGSNKIARIIKTIAQVTYALGLIAGFIIAVSSNISLALIIWGAAFVSGTIYLGFSEIIDLLQQIANKQK